MILKKSVTAALFYIVWVQGISATSYSKVYVNSGQNVGPYQFSAYGTPPVAYGAPLSQLTAAPLGSVVPYPQAASFLPPCVSPCISQEPVENARLVAYTAPRAPSVVTPDVPSNYEYSYVVYDDGTGDQKAARELSDGGVIRGQYSFLQPDGYVREVQYTADDINGFSAVINYLPDNGAKTVEVKEAKPCPEVKPEALKEESKEETSELEQKESEKKGAGSSESTNEPASKEKLSKEKTPAEVSSEEASDSKQKSENIGFEVASAEIPEKKQEPKSDTSKESEPSGETVTAEVKEEIAVVERVEAPTSLPAIVTNTIPLGYVSYDQLLKCIQKMQNANILTNSPLTYILLPSNSKAC